MKKSLIIAAVASIALAGCCCSRDYDEPAYDYNYVQAQPECTYAARDCAPVVHMASTQRNTIVRRTIQTTPSVKYVDPCAANNCAQTATKKIIIVQSY